MRTKLILAILVAAGFLLLPSGVKTQNSAEKEVRDLEQKMDAAYAAIPSSELCRAMRRMGLPMCISSSIFPSEVSSTTASVASVVLSLCEPIMECNRAGNSHRLHNAGYAVWGQGIPSLSSPGKGLFPAEPTSRDCSNLGNRYLRSLNTDSTTAIVSIP